MIELAGLALGGYDVERAPDVFDRQLLHFFGPNWSDRLSFRVEHADGDAFIIYEVDNATVFGLRGFPIV